MPNPFDPNPETGAFDIGDRVVYTAHTGQRFPGAIVEVGDKDGSLVYDVDLDNGDSCWGHPYQFKKLK